MVKLFASLPVFVDYGLISLTNLYKDKICTTLSNQKAHNVTWDSETIHIPDFFINDCWRSSKKYIVVPLGLSVKGTNGHANILFIDKTNMEVERFDPHGISWTNYNTELLDNILEKYFGKNGLKYIRPIDYCPLIGTTGHRFGPQMFEQDWKVGGGFCQVWTIWYIEHRLQLLSLTREQVMEKLMHTLQDLYDNDELEETFMEYIDDIQDLTLKDFPHLKDEVESFENHVESLRKNVKERYLTQKEKSFLDHVLVRHRSTEEGYLDVDRAYVGGRRRNIYSNNFR